MAQQYGSQKVTKAYEVNEREKKRQYNGRILEVEHGSFTRWSWQPLLVWEGNCRKA